MAGGLPSSSASEMRSVWTKKESYAVANARGACTTITANMTVSSGTRTRM